LSAAPHPDVLVIGAGIVGAACADALSAEGLSVAVLESQFAGGGATSAAMGHIVVMDDSDAQFALTKYSRQLWTELAPELPPACEDEATGTLWIAADAEEMEHVRSKRAAYRRWGVEVEELSSEDLAKAEPRLRPGLAGALLVPGDRVLYPPNAARFLLARAAARGVSVEGGVAATAIGPGRVETARGTIEAGVVVNAAGAAAPLLTPGLPIVPRKGHLVITERYPGFCRHQLVELGYLKSAHTPSPESVAFNLQPRATGQMLLGSSREFVGFDTSIHRRIVGRMIHRALEYVPALSRLSAIRIWTGFRPATPDNLPLIGPWGAAPGLYVAAGHEGLGITTSLATGRLLADAVVGRPGAIDREPYSPVRPMPGGAHA
jgi:glycine/D-amino acid oxidase-like deaminating enzyme